MSFSEFPILSCLSLTVVQVWYLPGVAERFGIGKISWSADAICA